MTDEITKTNTTTHIKVPSMWKVVIHNDDFTPVDFVVAVLNKLFNKSIEEATRLTLIIHNNGKANVGLYTKEIAKTKIHQVKENADVFGYPLLATTEEA